jgi:hypothetical protein
MTRSLLTLAAASLIALSGTAHAAAIAPEPASKHVGPNRDLKPENRNAALRYWAACSVISTDMTRAVADVDYEKTPAAKSDTLPDEYKRAAEQLSGWTSREFIDASRLARCDFEIDYENGVETLLPHLGKLRTGARLTRFDARRAAIEERPLDSAEAIAAMFRMGVHVSGDGYLISSLVGNAIMAIATEEATMQRAAGSLNDEAAKIVLAELRKLDASDPAGARASLDAEKDSMFPWIARTFQGPTAGRDLVERLGGMAPEESGADMLNRKLVAAMNQAQLAEASANAIRAYDELLAAWDTGADAPKAIKDLEARVAAGDYGAVAAMLLPSISKAHAATTRGAEATKALIEKLEKPVAANTTSAPASKEPSGR